MGVKIGDSVTLNEFEQKICVEVANKRHANNRQKGVMDRKMGDQSVSETDLYGVGAELSFCRLFNLYPDLSIEPRSTLAGTDVEKDSRLLVWRVDVKGTKYPFGRLLARPPDSNYATHAHRSTADLFALMTGPYPTFTFRGFCTKEDLLNPAALNDFGHGPTYAAQQQELYMPYLCCPDCENIRQMTSFSVTYVSAAEEKILYAHQQSGAAV